jgi:hypothetical protein
VQVVVITALIALVQVAPAPSRTESVAAKKSITKHKVSVLDRVEDVVVAKVALKRSR